MNGTFAGADLDRFRTLMAGLLGLDLDEGKEDFMAGVLRRRLEAHGNCSPPAYLNWLAASPHPSEVGLLASELTVTETYFFRSTEHSRVLAEVVLPERIRIRAAVRRLNLMSAGCASGEEAYSLAILLRECFPELDSWEVRIHGIDVNSQMVDKARKGRYAEWALRETPAHLREKYFRKDRSEYVLEERIRSMVSFQERNVTTAEVADAAAYDVVLFRNVMMYLVPEAARSAIAGLTRALADRGYLFLGYAETLRGLSRQFQLRHTHDTFYYQKSQAGDSCPELAQGNDSAPVFRSFAPRPPVPAVDASWFDAVQTNCRRIETLATAPPRAPGTARPEPRMQPAQIGLALELLRKERFGEALELLRALPPESARDSDTQLLRAVLLANCGDFETAENTCRLILGGDDLNASAHYLMALCRESAGDLKNAAEHDRAAIYLDATFAMPHLHLGRLAKREADWITARSELERAATLLLREDSPRLLLFGGGFSREALVSLSRAELGSSKGA